ncbi:golgin-84 isoform X1 [Cryptomeria japonica]|uniref:golgin-84 isoform X1 n=1 Tax=Cryptomeria japonica TaxID=3369 RepID=UPI0027DA2A63|nr:golgin-84 isoform X1 [Cryptomeria japonica]
MAFWLKAAEGLLEEVDRRAKQVVGELSDQQIEAQIAASEQDVIGRAEPRNSTGKRPKKTSLTKPLAKANGSQKESVQVTTQLPESDSILHRDSSSLSQENILVKSPNTNQPVQINQDVKLADSVVGELVKLSLPNDNNQKNDTVPEYPIKEDNVEAASTSTTGNLQGKTFDTSSLSANTIDSLATPELDHGAVECNFSAESGIVKVELLAKSAPSMETPERTGIISGNETDGSQKEFNEEKAQEYDSPKPTIQNEQPKEETPLSAIGVEDQLDEAQGVLKTAVSTGQSKEARLAKVCAGLSSRLQEYKSENAQLEELLAAERKEKNLCDTRIKQLEQEISLSKAATSAVEAGMADALASKNAEIELLMTSMESLKKQATVAEAKLATLQANTEAVMRNQKLTETRMIQTLREELASTERRAEEERAAHNATRMAAMEREAELEQRAAEASAALAKIQRTVDERTQRATDLEHKVSMFEIECATLTQELQELEARSRREQKRPTEEANLTSQAWREEAERARQAQREAEAKLFAMEAETQKMRVEMSSMKRDAEQYSKQAHMELEKRYRELTDLLYLKQTQLEAMSSEKAAAVFQLEKEAKRLRDLQAESERNRSLRRTSTPWDEDDSELKPLDVASLYRPLALQRRRMVGSSIRKAAKFLDSGAVSAGRFLWHHPLARLILLFYLVFVHIFLLYLLHRLQEQTERLLYSREAAAAMGLVNSGLP